MRKFFFNPLILVTLFFLTLTSLQVAQACQDCTNGGSGSSCETCEYVYNSNTGSYDYICQSNYSSVYYYNYLTLDGYALDERTSLPITLDYTRVKLYDRYGRLLATRTADLDGYYDFNDYYITDSYNVTYYTVCASAGINYPEKCYERSFYDSANSYCSIYNYQNFYLKAQPPKPTNIVFSGVTQTGASVSWQNGGGITTGFKINFAAGRDYPSCSGMDVGLSTSRSFSGLKDSTQYLYTVCAYDQYGTYSYPLNGQLITSKDPLKISISAGRNGYVGIDGKVWDSDSGLYAGSTGTFSTGNSIQNVTDSELYQYTRYGQNFQYSIPMTSGNYFAFLKFAEVYFSSANERIFNVSLNGNTVLSSLDLFAAAGGRDKAVDYVFPVAVGNGILKMDLVASKNNASINAIQVLAAGSGKSIVGTPAFPATAYVWNQYTAAVAAPTYTFGASTLSSLRSWIGYAGVSSKQNFAWSGLTAGRTYFVSYYPAFATDSVPYTANIVSGSATIHTGQTFVPKPPIANGNYYQVPTPWMIVFTANSSNVTLQLGNDQTSGAHYMYLDYVEGSNPNIPAFIAAPPTPTNFVASATTTSSLSFTWNSAGGTTQGFKFSSAAGNVSTLGCESGTDLGSATSYTLGSLQPSTTYTVALCSYNSVTTLSQPVRLVLNTANLPLPNSGSVLVNAGGSSYTAANGARWSADSGFSSSSTYQVSNSISNTVDQNLYQTSRYGSSFTYTANVTDGLYEITLKFAEPYVSGVGQRVFNTSVNGIQWLTNFDIFKESGGKFAAVDRSGYFNVTGGKVTIQLSAIANNAMISAVQISPVPTQKLVIGTPAFPSTVGVWNQFLSASANENYIVGTSNLSKIRSWIGYAGASTTQSFTWNNLSVGKSYYLNYYPAFATNSIPYFAEVTAGTATLTSGATFTPPLSLSTGNYYNGQLAWPIRFVAGSPSITIRMRNGQTSGAQYMYLNWVETVKP